MVGQPILPPATIGIIGGGQLGRMLASAARVMGYRIAILDPDPECPAAGAADELMVGGYDKTLMHRGEPAMRAEFERLGPVMRQGGFIPSVQAGRSSAAPAASLSPMPPPRRPRQLSPQLELTCCA